MATKSLKAKTGTRTAAQDRPPTLPVEDEGRHTHEVEDFVSRNRDALNESITRSRKEVAEGKCSQKTIDDIIGEGRKRHGRNS